MAPSRLLNEPRSTHPSALSWQIAGDLTLSDTERKSVIAARRGQGVFRADLEKIERACRLTGITTPSLLKAGHIKPWRACVTAKERLDGMNGLLLTPDADHLFDRGFISFENEGKVRISARVDREDLRRLGFDQLVFEATGLMEALPIGGPTASARSSGHISTTIERKSTCLR
jgi:hypothetical protein